jgi:hypothetical protein|tara:strand:- start:3171 stop:4100 length:930 start_codon:yes stop_codon:yes gene_type:complete
MNKSPEDDFDVDGAEGVTDEFEIEIEDDTPEADRGKPRRAEGVKPDIPEDDELEGYSESVKKRISKLKYEFHEERRGRETAERLREEAVKYATSTKTEMDGMRKRLTEGQGAVVSQAKARVETQLESAKANYKKAYEAGDADAMLDAQTSLNDLQGEMYRLSSYRAPPEPETRPAPAATAPSQQVAKPPKEALDWAEANPWFQTDTEMTGYAFGVHERLVKSGVDPNSESYYTELDASMRKRFSEKFDEPEVEVRTQARTAGSVVAPTTRSSKKPSKIVLTKSAVALAKRLGLTPQEYAAQIMKDMKNG